MGRFFGALLMFVGGAVAALTGSCAFILLSTGGKNTGMLFVLGIPFLVGLLIFAGGRAIYRHSNSASGDSFTKAYDETSTRIRREEEEKRSGDTDLNNSENKDKP